MVASIAAISFLALAAAWGLDFRQARETAPLQNRIAIYALPVSEEGQHPSLRPEGIAIAELAAAAFMADSAHGVHAYPLQWLYRAIPPDSSANTAYSTRFASRAGYPYFAISEMRNEGDSSFVSCSLYRAKRTAPFWRTQFGFRSGDIAGAARQLTSGLANALGQPAPSLPEVIEKPGWFYEMRIASLTGDRNKVRKIALAQLAKDSVETDALIQLAEIELSSPALQHKSKKDRERQLRGLSAKLANLSDRDSSDVGLARLAATAYYWREKFNEAAHYLRRALRHSPYGDSEAYRLLAKLHYSRYRPLGFLNEVEVYRYALRCNPANLDAVLDLAGVHILLKQTEAAQELLEHYQAIFPDNLRLLRALGEIYVMRGQSEKIFATYEQILQHDPMEADAYYNLGIYYFNSTDTLTAKRFFEKAIAVGDHRDSRMYLAKIAEKQRDYEKAIAHLRERIRLRTSADDAYAEEARRHLFDLMVMLGKIDSTGKVLE